MAPAVSVVELEGVVKRYRSGEERVEALKGVNFHADRGEMVTVVGPSGSGKSTMLNMIGLLDRPPRGRSGSTAAT